MGRRMTIDMYRVSGNYIINARGNHETKDARPIRRSRPGMGKMATREPLSAIVGFTRCG